METRSSNIYSNNTIWVKPLITMEFKSNNGNNADDSHSYTKSLWTNCWMDGCWIGHHLHWCNQQYKHFPSTRECLTSHSKSTLGNFQHQYLPELLVNMYNHHKMVKSVSCFCLHGSCWFLMNPVTYKYACIHSAYITYMYTYMHIDIQIQIQIHTHTHTHTHTQAKHIS